ncbi:hypothetical protein BLNAU_10645 [Blattamonas nauphoetae]|uniref:Transposase n=1 Tax=Blattamonas nauphoetae TaxID=2049346 RepID=A0ABQ9XPG7_9EUKA|nr:hypothetical protein BLNAU_10645 [Blattamonas nauphoetae]
MCDDAFFSFIYEVMRYGQENPDSQPQTLFPKFSRFRLPAERHSLSLKILNSSLSKMRNEQVSVAMDAGTIQGRHFLLVLLVNLRSDNSVVFYQLYQNISTAEEYSNAVCSILTDLETYGITPIAFVTDRLPAQMPVFRPTSSNYIGNFLPSTRIAPIPIHVPCSCHLLNSALQWTKKQDEFFASKLNTLKAATVEWRSHAAAFTTKIPDCMEHRWLWVDTILDFIDKYGQSVKVGPNSCETFNIRYQLNLIFRPFCSGIKHLERDYSSLSYTIPIVLIVVQRLFQSISQFSEEPWKQCAFCLGTNIIHLFLRTEWTPILLAAFSITKEGRDKLNLKRLGDLHTIPYSAIPFVCPSFETIQSKCRMIISTPLLPVEPEIVVVNEGEEWQNSSPNDTAHVPEPPMFTPQNLQQGIDMIGRTSFYNLVSDAIIAAATTLRIPHNPTQLSIQFNLWVSSSNERHYPSDAILSASPTAYWDMVCRSDCSENTDVGREQYEGRIALAKVAEAFLSIASSEAMCERTLATLRRILNDSNRSMTLNTVNDKMIIKSKK